MHVLIYLIQDVLGISNIHYLVDYSKLGSSPSYVIFMDDILNKCFIDLLNTCQSLRTLFGPEE